MHPLPLALSPHPCSQACSGRRAPDLHTRRRQVGPARGPTPLARVRWRAPARADVCFIHTHAHVLTLRRLGALLSPHHPLTVLLEHRRCRQLASMLARRRAGSTACICLHCCRLIARWLVRAAQSKRADCTAITRNPFSLLLPLAPLAYWPQMLYTNWQSTGNSFEGAFGGYDDAVSRRHACKDARAHACMPVFSSGSPVLRLGRFGYKHTRPWR